MSEGLSSGIVVDRYRVDGDIGAGSMGDVVRAVDVDLARPVAIKILSDRHRENEELRARFVREGRAVAAISHPNVVQVFTTGSFDDRPYIAMELLLGVDLGTVVAEHGTMSSLQAARAALDAARGLEAAAKAGLIHRDVKPSNLVLVESGVVKVTDFGLAKPLDPKDEPALTALGVVVGTPDYIAPEQARGEPIDERVDVYALGGTLYCLLTGSPPYRRGNPTDDKYLKVVARHLKDPAPDPHARNRTVDRELARLCVSMMAKRPVDRPAYPELIEQLSAIVDRLQDAGDDPSQPVVPIERGSSGPMAPTPFLGGQHRLPTGSEPADEPGPPPPPVRASPPVAGGSTALPRPRASRWLVAVTVLAALLFVVGLGLRLFGPMPGATHVPPPIADAAPPPPPPDAAAAPLPEPPEGMILLLREDGRPWLLADAGPVTHQRFAELFPKLVPPARNRRARQRPVTGVSFGHAASYARATGGRLPTPEEWRAVVAAEGAEADDDRWEWVDDGTQGTQARRLVLAPGDRSERRRPKGHRDVSFRLVRDL